MHCFEDEITIDKAQAKALLATEQGGVLPLLQVLLQMRLHLGQSLFPRLAT